MFGSVDRDKGRPLFNIALAFVLGAILLVSCAVTGSVPDKKITGASVRWEMNGNTYEGTVSFAGDVPDDLAVYRDSKVTVTAPEEIAGLAVTFSGATASASVGEVAFELPANTGEELYRMIRSLSVGEGKYTEITCGDETAYTVTYENGAPRSAAITWNGGEMTVEFAEVMCE